MNSFQLPPGSIHYYSVIALAIIGGTLLQLDT